MTNLNKDSQAVADGIKACVWDTFGTLLDWRTSVTRQVEAIAKAKGVEGDWADFTDQWRGYYYRWTAEIGQGKRQYLPVGYIHRQGLEDLLEKFGLKGLSEEEKVTLNKAWHRLDPWPDTVEGLTRLKSRFIMSPLSNSDFRMMVDMSKYAKLPWDAIMVAELAATYKPSPRFYLLGADLLNLEPSEVMMCAAHNKDLQWARTAGLRTAHISRPTEFGSQKNKYYQREIQADPECDFAASSVIELAKQLAV